MVEIKGDFIIERDHTCRAWEISRTDGDPMTQHNGNLIYTTMISDRALRALANEAGYKKG